MSGELKQAIKEMVLAAAEQLSVCMHSKDKHAQTFIQSFGVGAYRFHVYHCTGCDTGYARVTGSNGYVLTTTNAEIVPFAPGGAEYCYSWKAYGQYHYTGPVKGLEPKD